MAWGGSRGPSAARADRRSGERACPRARGSAVAPLVLWDAGLREWEGLVMRQLEELEMAIASLSDEEYREFRRWFLERDWERWDRQIDEDSKAGKLEFLVEEALEAKNGEA